MEGNAGKIGDKRSLLGGRLFVAGWLISCGTCSVRLARCDVEAGEGCRSCTDCKCSAGRPYGGHAADVPGFISAVRFDEGINVSDVTRRPRRISCR